VVSAYWSDICLHYKICQTAHKNYYYLNGTCRKTIPSLIRFHRLNRVPINKTSNACIQKAVERNHYAIFREQITLGPELGSGEFGSVYKGTFRTGLFTRVDVAVKTIKDDVGSKMSMDEKIKFLREANVMMRLKHKNVIQLYGVCVYDDPIWIVLECAEGGDLLKRLQKSKTSTSLKEKFSKEVCAGMAYLESFNVIHRDLAARNCFLGEKDTIKIGDFGLSAKAEQVEIRSGKVPIRWMPPEVFLQGIFTSKSDVWSYGAVLYEIWTDGLLPYFELNSAGEVGRRIKAGTIRLLPPNGMPEYLSELMKAALTFDHDSRPSFSDLQRHLSKKSVKSARSKS